MLGSDAAALRARLGFSEAEMAKRVGLSVDRYLAIEAPDKQVARLHTVAVEYVALAVAVERKEPDLALARIRRLALRYAMIVLDQRRPAASPSE